MGSINIIQLLHCPLLSKRCSAVDKSRQHRKKEIFGNAENRIGGSWLRSTNATSVLSRLPSNLLLFQDDENGWLRSQWRGSEQEDRQDVGGAQHVQLHDPGRLEDGGWQRKEEEEAQSDDVDVIVGADAFETAQPGSTEASGNEARGPEADLQRHPDGPPDFCAVWILQKRWAALSGKNPLLWMFNFRIVWF